MPDLYVGDSGDKTIWPLTQGGAAYDLTGATVAITFVKPDGSTLSKTGAVETPATGGNVSWTWAVGDLDQGGVWEAWFKTTKGTEILHGMDTFTVGTSKSA